MKPLTKTAVALVVACALALPCCVSVPVKPESFKRQECVSSYKRIKSGESWNSAGWQGLWMGPLFFLAGALSQGSEAAAGVIVGGVATVASPFMIIGGKIRGSGGNEDWRGHRCPENP